MSIMQYLILIQGTQGVQVQSWTMATLSRFQCSRSHSGMEAQLHLTKSPAHIPIIKILTSSSSPCYKKHLLARREIGQLTTKKDSQNRSVQDDSPRGAKQNFAFLRCLKYSILPNLLGPDNLSSGDSSYLQNQSYITCNQNFK